MAEGSLLYICGSGAKITENYYINGINVHVMAENESNLNSVNIITGGKITLCKIKYRYVIFLIFNIYNLLYHHLPGTHIKDTKTYFKKAQMCPMYGNLSQSGAYPNNHVYRYHLDTAQFISTQLSR